MDFILKEVPICADKEFEMIKITDDVRKVVEESGVEKGIVYVITEHTTTGITVNESLPCVEKDLMECLDRIASEDYPYHHNHYLPTYGTDRRKRARTFEIASDRKSLRISCFRRHIKTRTRSRYLFL